MASRSWCCGAAAALLLGACGAHTLRGADPDHAVSLPRDDAAHDDAQTEWWHFHGHLRDHHGHRYDWFLAFIRQHTDLDQVLGLPVRWFVDPFQVAYFAVTDRSAGTFVAREKHNFPDVWAADADAHRLAVHHDSWSANAAERGAITLRASSLANRLELELRPEKQASLIGDQGYLYVPPHSSSHYYSRPRMAATGTLTVAGEAHVVDGFGWFKHQWGFIYDQRLAGWVWFGVQLSSGQEVELGVVFDQDWNPVEGSFAAIQERDGSLTQLDPRTVGVRENGETWRSPRSRTVYPIGWILEIPGRGTLSLSAPVQAQEMVVFPANLWAGSLEVAGTFDGARVDGDCFTEVVGLDTPFGRSLLASGSPRDLPPDRPGRATPVANITSRTASAAPVPVRVPVPIPITVAAPGDVAAQTFAIRCAPCHGPRGHGDGPAAAGLVPPPRDLSQPSWQHAITDGQIERTIRDGGASIGLSAVMPAHPDLSGDPELLRGLRLLVRSFKEDRRP